MRKNESPIPRMLRTIPPVGCLVLAAVWATPAAPGIRIDGETYKKKKLAILQTQKKDVTQAAIVSYDRARATCLDKVDHPREKVRAVGGSYCARLAILPGAHTVEAKIVERDEFSSDDSDAASNYSPSFEGRPVTFNYEAGKVYQLHASIAGDVSIRCKTGQGGPLEWRRCSD